MTERIGVRGLHRVFGADAGLFGVDLTIPEGVIHALVGLNGAGKTTLMRLILGMLRPTAGEVLLNGVPLEEMPPAKWADVGALVEQPFAYPELDTRANLRLAARLRGIGTPRLDEVVAQAISELELDRYAHVRARRLSQGNRQRLGLAAALLHDPGTIVLDEPGNALDPAGVILLRENLLRRAGAGAGILVSSHHLDEVARVADRISVLNRGRIVGTLEPTGKDLERAFFELVRSDDERHRP